MKEDQKVFLSVASTGDLIEVEIRKIFKDGSIWVVGKNHDEILKYSDLKRIVIRKES